MVAGVDTRKSKHDSTCAAGGRFRADRPVLDASRQTILNADRSHIAAAASANSRNHRAQRQHRHRDRRFSEVADSRRRRVARIRLARQPACRRPSYGMSYPIPTLSFQIAEQGWITDLSAWATLTVPPSQLQRIVVRLQHGNIHVTDATRSRRGPQRPRAARSSYRLRNRAEAWRFSAAALMASAAALGL